MKIIFEKITIWVYLIARALALFGFEVFYLNLGEKMNEIREGFRKKFTCKSLSNLSRKSS